MKLDDPFGRLERRHQAGYEVMAEALRQSGVDTRGAAEQVIRDSWKRMLKLTGTGLLLLLLVSLLWQEVIPLTFGAAVFLIGWSAASMRNGRRYIRKYIEEELN